MIVDHGLVVDREQVFVRDFCEGVEAGAGAACEDDAFHIVLLQINFLVKQ